MQRRSLIVLWIVAASSLALLACRGEEGESDPASESPATTDLSAKESDSETITIPLDQIWAYDMPGTRDIAELESNGNPHMEHGPVVLEIRRSLGVVPKGHLAKVGFAVVGEGMDALREAHAVFTEKRKPSQTLSTGSNISIVFFSHQSNPYVHLDKVERKDNTVDIYYHFVPHETMDTSEHLALIPLGGYRAASIT